MGELLAATLLTAIYGNFDPLRALPADHGFDEAVCVTDNPNLQADGWEIFVVPTTMPHRLSSKVPKMMPFLFTNNEYAVWLDAAFEIVGPGFHDFCIDSVKDYDFVVWDHPDRHMRPDAYAEANYSQNMAKYNGQDLHGQTSHYLSEGFPAGSGLWACGTIVWRNCDASREFGSAWFGENVTWTIQDQVSFPYLVWKMQPNFGVFPAHEYENPYLKWWMHERNV